MSDKPERSRDDVATEQKSEATITRRDSLKKLAVTAYAAPATMMLLTSKRAVAQSRQIQCQMTVENFSSVSIDITHGPLTVSPGNTRIFEYFGATIPINFQTNPSTTVNWNITPGGFYFQSPYINYVGTNGSDCLDYVITVTDAPPVPLNNSRRAGGGTQGPFSAR